MQQFMVSMSNQSGGLGWSGETAQFLKLKILESFSLDANGGSNKMYRAHLTKVSIFDALNYTAILSLL